MQGSWNNGKAHYRCNLRWRGGFSAWASRRRSRPTWPTGWGTGLSVLRWPRGRRSRWSAPTNCSWWLSAVLSLHLAA